MHGRYQHVGIFWHYPRRQSPTPMLKFALLPTPTPDASQWNIGGVGPSGVGAGVGHVHFMLFMSISFASGTQRKLVFQWNMGFHLFRGVQVLEDRKQRQSLYTYFHLPYHKLTSSFLSERIYSIFLELSALIAEACVSTP